MKKLHLILLFTFFFSCSHDKNDIVKETVVINERYQTDRDTSDNIDSPSFWKGGGGENWIISTAKSTDVLIVDDAATGKNIERIGGEGIKLGKLDRPNGIFVIDNLVAVVERDNRRVQI